VSHGFRQRNPEATQRGAVPPNRRRAQPFLRVALIIAAGLGITAATWSAFRYGVEPGPPGLPVMGKIPAFSLIASSGEALSQANLAGSVWIADFIFTRCPSICPRLSEQMAKLQSALAREVDAPVRLVSFSVDPANDTPQVLRDYAERFHADPNRWLFVTGERAPLYALIGDGFHLAVAQRSEAENRDNEGLITHSDRFVLVDRDLQIRGYYHGSDDDVITQLLRDIKALTKGTGKG
jgi:protein SCO1/2